MGMAFMVLMLSATLQKKEPKPWPVPAEYKNKKNAVAQDAEVLASGKALFNKNCASCHGKKGLGDGPKANSCETFAGDFSSAAFQSQTDGELYFKTALGRDEMPGYEKKLGAEAIWEMVHYMRTMKK